MATRSLLGPKRPNVCSISCGKVRLAWCDQGPDLHPGSAKSGSPIDTTSVALSPLCGLHVVSTPVAQMCGWRVWAPLPSALAFPYSNGRAPAAAEVRLREIADKVAAGAVDSPAT